MIEFDYPQLQRVGLTQAMLSSALASDLCLNTNSKLMRVSEVQRERILVHDGARALPARLLPKLHRALEALQTAIAVGDWVLLTMNSAGEYWVHARIEPTNSLVRRDGSGKRHPVASNVDTALLVMGLDDDFNPRRLERYLSLAQSAGVMPVLVLTKADVCADVAALRAQLDGRVPLALAIITLDARDGLRTMQALSPYCIAGNTLVLLGSSGAGKSTLTNSLLGANVQDTGEVRAHDSRGKHTTTARTLHLLAQGACIIDTPGVRTLQPDTDAETLTHSFADIAALATHCKFANCAHENEPDCAVRAALSADRLKNFHKLLRESQRDSMTPLDRQKQLSQWKARGRAGRIRLQEKRGA